jgi:hypothetical protein
MTWYSIDDGITNYTFSEEFGTINISAWDAVDDGLVTITFYANDSLGNLGNAEIIVRKDTIAPNITILYPINETFGINPPDYIVLIKDENLHSMWYSFNVSSVDIIFTQNSTILNQEWDKLSNGIYKLTFYANDSAGNISYREIIIIKSISETNQDLTVLIGIVISLILISSIGLVSYIVLIIKKIKFKGT